MGDEYSDFPTKDQLWALPAVKDTKCSLDSYSKLVKNKDRISVMSRKRRQDPTGALENVIIVQQASVLAKSQPSLSIFYSELPNTQNFQLSSGYHHV